jgi:hypothetical protein
VCTPLQIEHDTYAHTWRGSHGDRQARHSIRMSNLTCRRHHYWCNITFNRRLKLVRLNRSSENMQLQQAWCVLHVSITISLSLSLSHVFITIKQCPERSNHNVTTKYNGLVKTTFTLWLLMQLVALGAACAPDLWSGEHPDRCRLHRAGLSWGL